MKRLLKHFIAAILGWQVRRLYKKNQFKVVAVTGSIGKTSTKLAVATVLAQKFKVRYQQGNYNDLVSVPLVFFGQSLPVIYSPFAWLSVFLKNEAIIRHKYPYEVVVVELGTDGPGQIAEFKSYIKADIGILTSVTPEHMAFFTDLDAVAREELSIADLSQTVLVNVDLTDKKYLSNLANFTTYGRAGADYQLSEVKFQASGAGFTISKTGTEILKSAHSQVTEPQLYSILAASAVADMLGADAQQIDAGIKSIQPVNGRMQQLAGINNSLIIDDTYNASPEAVKAALDTLYRLPASQKIALLGNMNELGKYSKDEHIAIGNYCDPAKLDLVVTLGPDANAYLAPAAEAKGCQVKTFDNPYDAGEFLKTQIKSGALTLAKGSQNKVYAEEAVKLILANPADSAKLVRQSPDWLKIKQKNFA
jgi:UDP-N-acetylmuramoyl-tripeptide--D-alanyl-D-alanine ligase